MSLVLGILAVAGTCFAAPPDSAPHLRVEQFRLANGLRVVLAPDSVTPYVAVESWYATGTRDDPPGKQGLAHLFEHLWSPPRRLFTNPANAAARTRVVNNNAQTRLDYTRYYTEVRAQDIALALAMHADRMDAPDSLLTDALIAQTIDVVINEGRQGASPDGFSASRLSFQRIFPPDHPYAANPASEATLRSITRDDVRAWRNLRYGPDNAILLIVGNFDARAVRGDVDRVFGGIASHADRTLLEPHVSAEPAPLRADRATVGSGAPRVILRWSTPGYGDADAELVQLGVLALARSQRSHGAPVTQMELSELAGDVQLQHSGADARALASSARIIDSAIHDLAATGPSPRDLAWAKREWTRALLATFETLGFQESRAEALGEGALFAGDAEYYRTRMRLVARATPSAVAGAARRWMLGHGYTLATSPRPAPGLGHTVPLFSDTIALAPIVPARIPALVELRIARGPQLVIGVRASASLVRVSLLVPALDGRHAAAVNDAMARTLAERLATVTHTHIERAANADQFSVSLTGGRGDLKRMIAAVATLLPALPDSSWLAAAHGGIASPSDNDIARGLAMGAANRWAVPDSESIAAWFRGATDGAVARQVTQALSGADVTLFVGGNVREGEIMPLVKAAFAAWPVRASNDRLSTVSSPAAPGIRIRAAAGRAQTRVVAVLPLPADVSPAVEALLESDLQGSANARLRVERQWTYGVASRTVGPPGARTLLVWSDVQRDRAANAVTDMEGVFATYHTTDATRDTAAIAESFRQHMVRATQTVDGLEQIVRDALNAGVAPGEVDHRLQATATVRAADVERARAIADPAALRFLVVGAAVHPAPDGH